MENLKTPGEVGKMLGCSRQNITERIKKLNNEKLAFKNEQGWHITEKGIEYLKEHSKKINELKSEPRACENNANNTNEVIELYKKIIEDKDKQLAEIKAENEKTVNSLIEQYQKIYELARNLMQQMEKNQLLLTDNNNCNALSNNVENSANTKKWWQFWK
ncbi:MAG: hypothetical protein IJW82_03150 [Clostridia bacterium]|nr:hypothetical protein [Clostridia bacterium]